MSAVNDLTVYLAQAFQCHAITRLVVGDDSYEKNFSPASNRTLLTYHLSAEACCTADGKWINCLCEAINAAPLAVISVATEINHHAAITNARELASALCATGLHVDFCGRAPPPVRNAVVIVREKSFAPAKKSPPDDFKILAIVPAYNEEDIIAQTINYLIEEGLQVYVLDNWSTDRTYALACDFLGRGLIGIERFPVDGSIHSYDLTAILARVEKIAAAQSWASWIVLHDVDERRRSPWPHLRLREALWHVHQDGFSCVDHVTLNFWPIDNSFDSHRIDLEDHFKGFEFSAHPGHFHQRRAWKQLKEPVDLTSSAGHDVRFPGRKVYPYKFLLKHYPIRSQTHGLRKVLYERKTRWNKEERALGWHRQYDESTTQFLRDSQTLTRFEADTFYENYLLQGISGIGIFARPPAWATPPRW